MSPPSLSPFPRLIGSVDSIHPNPSPCLTQISASRQQESAFFFCSNKRILSAYLKEDLRQCCVDGSPAVAFSFLVGRNPKKFPPLSQRKEERGGKGLMLEGECLQLPCGSRSGSEEEVPVLPCRTKVVIRGNNRTKSMLVGFHAVVTKAVGLGGWHWLVLPNGLEVKLQRNALSVIEPPTGNEEDGNNSEEHPSNLGAVEDFSKSFKPRVQIHKYNAVTKPMKRCRLIDPSLAGSKSRILKVNFRKLEESTLLRYWKRYNLDAAALRVDLGLKPFEDQLVDAVERHFLSLQLDELQVIASFVQAAKRLKAVYS